jgi:hypothetical protein
MNAPECFRFWYIIVGTYNADTSVLLVISVITEGREVHHAFIIALLLLRGCVRGTELQSTLSWVWPELWHLLLSRVSF